MNTKSTEEDRQLEQAIRNQERLARYKMRSAQYALRHLEYLRRTSHLPMFLRSQAD